MPDISTIRAWVPVLNDAWDHSQRVRVLLKSGDAYRGNVVKKLGDTDMLVTVVDHDQPPYSTGREPVTIALGEIASVQGVQR
ncbi:hypothetical protein ACWEOE_10790 [Amycolatopsis sp. NPDC004368]